MTIASKRRLPVELVVKRSFLYAWESRHILAAPYAIYAAVTILLDLLSIRVVGTENPVPMFILQAAEQIFAMAFAVGIHRFVLLGETRPGFQFFRWDRHFVRYVLLTMLFLILILLATVMMAGALGGNPEATASAGGAQALFALAVMLIPMLVALTVLCRLVMMLPAAALGDPVRAKEIWVAMQGNSLRLLATIFVTLLPFIVLDAVLMRVAPAAGEGMVGLLVIFLAGLIAPLQLIVVTIMLALSYDVLIRGGGPQAAGG